uniref:Thioredoxin domain-containing protein n=1 Tax=Arcella intermedia TaxID=1963864 RepID=A0A6B2LTR0_9EUKA
MVVVDFSATWCGPCQMIAPIYEKLAKKYTSAIFLHVDADEMKGKIADLQDVTGLPTFKFFKNSSLLTQIVGADPNQLEATVNKYK